MRRLKDGERIENADLEHIGYKDTPQAKRRLERYAASKRRRKSDALRLIVERGIAEDILR